MQHFIVFGIGIYLSLLSVKVAGRHARTFNSDSSFQADLIPRVTTWTPRIHRTFARRLFLQPMLNPCLLRGFKCNLSDH